MNSEHITILLVVGLAVSLLSLNLFHDSILLFSYMLLNFDEMNVLEFRCFDSLIIVVISKESKACLH